MLLSHCGEVIGLQQIKTLRCCLEEHLNQSNVKWRSVNPNPRDKKYLLELGITKEVFHAITWFTSWAVDADHGANLPDVTYRRLHLKSIERKQCGGDDGVEDIVQNMKAAERAVLGFMCKQIIDTGRLMWMKDRGLEAEFVKYVPSSVSPENHLLIGIW
ncbi:hypothetical protein C1H46_013026 [Malus baccata]|uniref:tRNA:m(4)X modification enzyme TRM13 n=1 Tax=Malus baccata TaxID=106549 RepID=A0A540MRB7_MALBA|nr:hypothetical protein C1H46_013026 [Malus baccata]